jgi:hypothetical protein
MHRGRFLMTGTPDTIRSAMPGKLYDLTCRSPQKAYRELRTEKSSSEVVLYGDRLHVRIAPKKPDISHVGQFLESKGLGPVQWHEVEPSLEDAFVALVENETNPGDSS